MHYLFKMVKKNEAVKSNIWPHEYHMLISGDGNLNIGRGPYKSNYENSSANQIFQMPYTYYSHRSIGDLALGVKTFCEQNTLDFRVFSTDTKIGIDVSAESSQILALRLAKYLFVDTEMNFGNEIVK